MAPGRDAARGLTVLPKTFKLVNRTWRVKLVSAEEMARQDENDTHTTINPHDASRGLCDPFEAVIYLNRDFPTDDIVHSFWHEIGHAMLFASGAFSRKAHNEHIVDHFGALMAQMWTTCKGDLAL